VDVNVGQAVVPALEPEGQALVLSGHRRLLKELQTAPFSAPRASEAGNQPSRNPQHSASLLVARFQVEGHGLSLR
jgi:hypothetical protein